MLLTRPRLTRLVFLGIAIFALTLLATGLSNVHFAPGYPFRFSRDQSQILSIGRLQIQLPDLGFLLNAIAFGLFFLLLFALVQFFLSAKARRRVLRNFITIFALFYAFYWLVTQRGAVLQNLLQGTELPSVGETSIPELTGNLGPPPDWFGLVLSVGLSMVVLGSVYYAWRRLRRPEEALDQLAEEAQLALEMINSGAKIHATVIRCYHEMLQILSVRQGVHRQAAMTPREFVLRLETVGMPGEHIGRLTRLFEAARYGAKVDDPRAEQEAIDCLSAIAKTHGSAR